jgi:hypothetical protein
VLLGLGDGELELPPFLLAVETLSPAKEMAESTGHLLIDTWFQDERTSFKRATVRGP